MENLDIFSYASEAPKRDAALAQVESNSDDWTALAMIEMRELSRDSSILRDYPNGFTMTNVRQWLVPLLGQPHHHNCLGALAMKCIRAGLLHDTGRISRTGAHARKQSVYRFA